MPNIEKSPLIAISPDSQREFDIEAQETQLPGGATEISNRFSDAWSRKMKYYLALSGSIFTVSGISLAVAFRGFTKTDSNRDLVVALGVVGLSCIVVAGGINYKIYNSQFRNIGRPDVDSRGGVIKTD